MIKRIIFDLDNTLIQWEDEKNWDKVYKNISKQYEISAQQFKEVKKMINNYEYVEEIFNEEIMQKMINEILQQKYTTEFIKIILSTFAECVPEQKDAELEEVLKYLSTKYELVVLTNWFGWQQEKRLQKYGIYKYFKNVYGADKFKIKPNKEAYEIAVGDNKPNECIMIGDGIQNDVEGAIQNGLNAILFNPNYNEQKEKNNYKTIKNFNELKSIL